MRQVICRFFVAIQTLGRGKRGSSAVSPHRRGRSRDGSGYAHPLFLRGPAIGRKRAKPSDRSQLSSHEKNQPNYLFNASPNEAMGGLVPLRHLFRDSIRGWDENSLALHTVKADYDDMKPITTSVYTFSKLIDDGFLYVDKTEGIYDLIAPGTAQYFLARPRRFGKSLLVSTLKAIFQGRRELFDGLAIADTDYEWQSYPVIHLDLGTAAAQTAAELEAKLIFAMDHNAKQLNISLTQKCASGRFQELVNNLSERDGKVVILVDEYDKPLLGHLEKPSAPEIQRVLKEFYAVIKTTEPQQRFVLLTGVSKFSKVSVFSDLNNLTDLTMRRSTATLLGYTQDELEQNFSEYIAAMSKELGKSYEETLEELRVWYNGYRFHSNAQTVYNPVSTMKCFQELEFKNYWFETGTPTFLISMLQNNPIDLSNLSADETDFSTYELEHLSALPLLVQTGYLTIKGTETFGDATTYKLGYPNREIERSFNRWLAQDFAHIPGYELTSTLQLLINALNESRIDDMLEHLKTFFHNIPYDISIKHEKYYQTIFYAVFQLIGTAIEAEARTNIGRIDALIKTKTNIYIFEFKLNGTAEEAMAQIHEKKYAAPYRDDGRNLILIGAEFDKEARNLGKWLIESA